MFIIAYIQTFFITSIIIQNYYYYTGITILVLYIQNTKFC